MQRQVVDVYMVPEAIPMRESQVVAIELLDSIVFNAFGTHFLEPTQSVKMVPQVRPTVLSNELASKVLQDTLGRARVNHEEVKKGKRAHEWDVGRELDDNNINHRETDTSRYAGGANDNRLKGMSLGRGGAALGLEGSIRMN